MRETDLAQVPPTDPCKMESGGGSLHDSQILEAEIQELGRNNSWFTSGLLLGRFELKMQVGGQNGCKWNSLCREAQLPFEGRRFSTICKIMNADFPEIMAWPKPKRLLWFMGVSLPILLMFALLQGCS